MRLTLSQYLPSMKDEIEKIARADVVGAGLGALIGGVGGYHQAKMNRAEGRPSAKPGTSAVLGALAGGFAGGAYGHLSRGVVRTLGPEAHHIRRLREAGHAVPRGHQLAGTVIGGATGASLGVLGSKAANEEAEHDKSKPKSNTLMAASLLGLMGALAGRGVGAAEAGRAVRRAHARIPPPPPRTARDVAEEVLNAGRNRPAPGRPPAPQPNTPPVSNRPPAPRQNTPPQPPRSRFSMIELD